MAKDFFEELHEALLELKDAEAERLSIAIEARKFPPIPMLPHTVLKTVIRVAAKHKITEEELLSVLGLREMTASDRQLLKELSEKD